MRLDSPILQSVAEYLSRHFQKELQIVEAIPLGGGCINHTYRIKTENWSFFLKWNSDGANDMFECEEQALREFAKGKISDLVVPQSIVSKPIDQTPGFLVLELLNGAPGSALMEEQLGRGLAQLHKVVADQFGFYTNNYCGSTRQINNYQSSWIDFYRENRLHHLIELIAATRGLSQNELKTFDRFLIRLDRLLNYPSRPSLVHGDLWSGNYMFTTKGPAIIDPAASYSDREFEFGIMKMFGGFSQRTYDAYQEFWPLEKGWQERNKLYQLYHVLNHFYLFGGFYKNQALDIVSYYL